MAKVRIGIVGIGKMGSLHALKLKFGLVKNATVGAVCDIDPKRIEWAKNKLKGIKTFTDYNEMMDSGLIDAVLIATPHYDHPVIGTVSLEKGLHTLIEKPIGVYTKNIRELNEFAKTKKDLVFGIMYNQRTDKLYRKAKEIMDSGAMGEIKRINWIITNWYRPQAYYDQGGWRGTWAGEGGGVLINQCPHQLDLFQWLGGMPTKVKAYAKVGYGRDINVENDVTAYFEYKNGASGVFITSTHDYPGTNRLEIDADGGKIVIENNKLVYDRLNTLESEFNKTNKRFMPRIPKRRKVYRTSVLGQLVMFLFGQHTAIMKDFANAITNKTPLIAPGLEGINGLTISNAIHLSSWTGKEIELPIDEDLFIKELDKRKQEEEKMSRKKI